jgi:hypothetical protein
VRLFSPALSMPDRLSAGFSSAEDAPRDLEPSAAAPGASAAAAAAGSSAAAAAAGSSDCAIQYGPRRQI